MGNKGEWDTCPALQVIPAQCECWPGEKRGREAAATGVACEVEQESTGTSPPTWGQEGLCGGVGMSYESVLSIGSALGWVVVWTGPFLQAPELSQHAFSHLENRERNTLGHDMAMTMACDHTHSTKRCTRCKVSLSRRRCDQGQ